MLPRKLPASRHPTLYTGASSTMLSQLGHGIALKTLDGGRFTLRVTPMNKQAIALLSLGHFLIDFCQGVVPALVPFLVIERKVLLCHGGESGLCDQRDVLDRAAALRPACRSGGSMVALAREHFACRREPGAGIASRELPEWCSRRWVLSGLGVAAFHPEAARKAHLASGDQRTTGMSYFSVGGGLGFALAPVITTAMLVSWGMTGLLALLVPTGSGRGADRAFRWAKPPRRRMRLAAVRASPATTIGGRFGILSGATVCRSIVFYGLNTFLALYFMSRWDSNGRCRGNRALAIFLGTSIVGTLTGGYLADRLGRRRVIRIGFAGGVVFLALFALTTNRQLALVLLVPLAIFLFMPTSVLVVLGQEYLPRRVGMASGVTLGLAVSVGGMCAPLLGSPGRSARAGQRRPSASGRDGRRGVSDACLAAGSLPPR